MGPLALIYAGLDTVEVMVMLDFDSLTLLCVFVFLVVLVRPQRVIIEAIKQELSVVRIFVR